MSLARAKKAVPGLRALPGVQSVLFDSRTNIMHVMLTPVCTVAQRNKVVVTLAKDAGH